MNNKKYNWNGVWTIRHYRKGKLIYEDIGKNSLVQEGEEALLEVFFRGDSTYTPTQFYVRLCNSTPSITSTLATIVDEVSTGGYTAQLLERSSVGFSTKDITSGGNYRLTSKVITFTASGESMGPATNAYLATTSDNSGKLIAFRALSMARTIIDGDSMTIQIQIDLG